MNVSLNEHFENFVAQQLKEGRYNNASEIVRAGLRLLEEQELKLKELRGDIQRGIDSGKETWDKTSFLNEAHARGDKLEKK